MISNVFPHVWPLLHKPCQYVTTPAMFRAGYGLSRAWCSLHLYPRLAIDLVLLLPPHLVPMTGLYLEVFQALSFLITEKKISNDTASYTARKSGGSLLQHKPQIPR